MTYKISTRKERFSEFHTDIDEVDLKKEELIVRGVKLTDMIAQMDFTDAIYHTLLHKKPSEVEKRLLNASMVSIHTGYQAYPPSIMFPRIAISTGASVTQAMAAGYCSSGDLHLGAIGRTMEAYVTLDRLIIDNVYKETRKLVRRKLESHEMLFGFGHPLLKKDPRPDALREFARSLNYDSIYLMMYDAIVDELYEQKHKHANVDGINGAILLSLGFKPEHGTGLFLISRSIGMLAHISEELQRPAWYAWSSLVARNIPGMKEVLEKDREDSKTNGNARKYDNGNHNGNANGKGNRNGNGKPKTNGHKRNGANGKKHPVLK